MPKRSKPRLVISDPTEADLAYMREQFGDPQIVGLSRRKPPSADVPTERGDGGPLEDQRREGLTRRLAAALVALMVTVFLTPPLARGQNIEWWVEILAPTQTYSDAEEPLWIAQPGEWYRLRDTQPFWWLVGNDARDVWVRFDDKGMRLGSPPSAAVTRTTAPPAPSSARPQASPVQPSPKERSIAPELLPAWHALGGLSVTGGGETLDIGAKATAIVDLTGVRLVVGSLPRGTSAVYRAKDNTITVNRSIVSEDPRAVAAVLYHELIHAVQRAMGEVGVGTCVANEVQAYVNQSFVWASFANRDQRYDQGRTTLERQLNATTLVLAREGEPGLYKLVVDEGSYQTQCSLWVP